MPRARTLRMSERSIAPRIRRNNLLFDYLETQAEYVHRMIHEEQVPIRFWVWGMLGYDDATDTPSQEQLESFYQRAYREYGRWHFSASGDATESFNVSVVADAIVLDPQWDEPPPPVLLPPPVLPVLPPPVLPPPQPKLPKDLLVPEWCGDCDWMCSICLEDNPELSRVKTACGHEFHKECLDGLKRAAIPSWRTWLPEYDATNPVIYYAVGDSPCKEYPEIELVYVPSNTTWYVPCPLCRTTICLDTGIHTGKWEFYGWLGCTCCERHIRRRPSSYHWWVKPPWGNDDPVFTGAARACKCPCRRRSRELVRQLW